MGLLSVAIPIPKLFILNLCVDFCKCSESGSFFVHVVHVSNMIISHLVYCSHFLSLFSGFHLCFFLSWDRGDSRPAPRNSRWNDGGGGGGRGGGQINAKGFHGNMSEDPRLEKRLFNTKEHASQGINFDRVGSVPLYFGYPLLFSQQNIISSCCVLLTSLMR